MIDDLKTVFRADGVLCFAFDFYEDEDWHQALLPVRTIEEIEGRSLFLPALLGSVEIEEGTPLSAMMIALHGVWRNHLAEMFGIDLDAYLAEMRRPLAVKDRLDLLRIEVSGAMILQPRVRYDDDGRAFREANETRVYRPPPVRPLNEIEIEFGWDAAGIEKGEAIPVGLSETPINTFAHVPVVIKNRIHVVDRSQMLPDHIKTKQMIFNRRFPLTKSRKWGKDDGRIARFKAHLRPNFFEFIRCLLAAVCTFKSPERRRQYFEEKERKAALNEALDRQEGKENMQIARGGFDALFEHGAKLDETTRKLMAEAQRRGVAVKTRKQS